jgi:hypothetical protein
MAFRYYLTCIYDGEVFGTNDSQVAEDASLCEEIFVIDTQDNTEIVSNEKSSIREYRTDSQESE